MSDTLLPHGLQHARLPCPPLFPRVCSNSCPLSQWCCLTISSSATFFSFALNLSQHQSQLFAPDGQSIGASASVLPMNIQGWFPLGLANLISLQSKGLLRVFFNTTIWKHQFLSAQPSCSHLYMTTGKTIALTIQTFVGKGISLLFNMLSRFCHSFSSKEHHLLISWLQSPSTMILEPPKIN